MSSFAPTRDTSANRVAALFDGFKGLRDYRAEENGAEWVCGKAQALTAIARSPLDHAREMLPNDEVFLRIWTPSFTRLGPEAPVDVTLEKARRFLHAHSRRGDPEPVHSSKQHLTLDLPIAGQMLLRKGLRAPSSLILEPGEVYLISGRIRDGRK